MNNLYQQELFRAGQFAPLPLPLPDKPGARPVVAAPPIVFRLEELLERRERFACIYADPPWLYQNHASRGAAINHYPVMTLDEICALPIAKLAHANAHLHLWTTNGFLFEARQVIEAWGFAYKSCFVWVKDKMGMGNYWRVSHELLILGVRGHLPFTDKALKSWLRAARTTHSTKPDIVRELVERASPAPRLELFGRRAWPGWTSNSR
jgi:N6-adenosine-specific RNA methylase IME4